MDATDSGLCIVWLRYYVIGIEPSSSVAEVSFNCQYCYFNINVIILQPRVTKYKWRI
jgi:hypothetical protein